MNVIKFPFFCYNNHAGYDLCGEKGGEPFTIKIYSAGDNIPNVGISSTTQIYESIHFLASTSKNYFDWSGTNTDYESDILQRVEIPETFDFLQGKKYLITVSYEGIDTADPAGDGHSIRGNGTANSENARISLSNGIFGAAGNKFQFGLYNDDTVNVATATTHYISSNITSTTTFNSKHTYIIQGDIEINSGVTLKVLSGAIINFATSSSLTVNGTLNINGAGRKAGYVKMVPATSTSETPGTWKGITINSGGTANITGAAIILGGSSGSIIHNNGGTLTINDSTIGESSSYAIKLTSGTSSIEGTDIASSTVGIYYEGGTIGEISDNAIHDNSLFGIYNETTTTITAENNYWGYATGPKHPTNTNGQGNLVSDYVDFKPFTTNKHYIFPHEYACPDMNDCWSVNKNNGNPRILITSTSTNYGAFLSQATSTWNTYGSSTALFGTATSTAELIISDDPRSDVVYIALWTNVLNGTDKIELNSYYIDDFLNNSKTSTVVGTIIHELGHALGLDHSYLNNVMNFFATPQDYLGDQDKSDFDYMVQNYYY